MASIDTTPSSGNGSKTAAEAIRDKATAQPLSPGSEQITTNPEEAHKHTIPAIARQQTSSTIGAGADDNASMIPLGKGNYTEAPQQPQGSSSVSAPSGNQEESFPAKAYALAEVACCTQGREGMIVAPAESGRITPTGQQEVGAAVSHSYPPIEEILKHITGKDNVSPEQILASSPPQQQVLSTSDTTMDTSSGSGDGSKPIRTTTNEMKGFDGSMPQGPAGSQIITGVHGQGESGNVGKAAAAASTEGSATPEKRSSTPPSATAEALTAANTSPRSSGGGFAARLRQEIEERARAARENKEYTGPGSAAAFIKPRDNSIIVDTPTKSINQPSSNRNSLSLSEPPNATETTSVTEATGDNDKITDKAPIIASGGNEFDKPEDAVAPATIAAGTGATAAVAGGTTQESAAPSSGSLSRSASNTSLNRNSADLTSSPSKSKGSFKSLFRRGSKSKRNSLGSSSQNASQVSLTSAGENANTTQAAVANDIPEGMGAKGKVSEPPIGANRRRTLTSGSQGGEAATAAAAVAATGEVHALKDDHTATTSADIAGPTGDADSVKRSSEGDAEAVALANDAAAARAVSEDNDIVAKDQEVDASNTAAEAALEEIKPAPVLAKRRSVLDDIKSDGPRLAAARVAPTEEPATPTAAPMATAMSSDLESQGEAPMYTAPLYTAESHIDSDDKTRQAFPDTANEVEADGARTPKATEVADQVYAAPGSAISTTSLNRQSTTEATPSPSKSKGFKSLFRRSSSKRNSLGSYSRNASQVSLASATGETSAAQQNAESEIPEGMGAKGKVSEPPIGANRRRTLTNGDAAGVTAAAAVAAVGAGAAVSTPVGDHQATSTADIAGTTGEADPKTTAAESSEEVHPKAIAADHDVSIKHEDIAQAEQPVAASAESPTTNTTAEATSEDTKPSAPATLNRRRSVLDDIKADGPKLPPPRVIDDNEEAAISKPSETNVRSATVEPDTTGHETITSNENESTAPAMYFVQGGQESSATLDRVGESAPQLTRSPSKSKGFGGLFRRSSKRNSLGNNSRNASSASLVGASDGPAESADSSIPEGQGWKGKVSEPPIGANRRRTLTSGSHGGEAATAAAAVAAIETAHAPKDDHTTMSSADIAGPTGDAEPKEQAEEAATAEHATAPVDASDHAVSTEQKDASHSDSTPAANEGSAESKPTQSLTRRRSVLDDIKADGPKLPPPKVAVVDGQGVSADASNERVTASEPDTIAASAADPQDVQQDTATEADTRPRSSAFTEDFDADTEGGNRGSYDLAATRSNVSLAGQSTDSLGSTKKKGFLSGLFRRKSKRASLPANYKQSGSMVSLASIQSTDSATREVDDSSEIAPGTGWKGKVSEPPIGANRRRTLTGGSTSGEAATAAAAVASTEHDKASQEPASVAEPAFHDEDGMLATVPEEGNVADTSSVAGEEAHIVEPKDYEPDTAVVEHAAEPEADGSSTRPRAVSMGGLAAQLREEAAARAQAEKEGRVYEGPGAASYAKFGRSTSVKRISQIEGNEDANEVAEGHIGESLQPETMESAYYQDEPDVSRSQSRQTLQVYSSGYQQTPPTTKAKKRFSLRGFFGGLREKAQYATAPRSSVQAEQEHQRDYQEYHHDAYETEERDPDLPDDRSINAIAASIPLPEPTYTPSVAAKRERIRQKREHAEKLRREKEERRISILSRRERILNAYTGPQDFSSVPVPERTKPFGRNKEIELAAIQHIVKPDRATRKAEEAEDKEIARRGYAESEPSENEAPAEIVAETAANRHEQGVAAETTSPVPTTGDAGDEHIPAATTQTPAKTKKRLRKHIPDRHERTAPVLPEIAHDLEPLDIRAIVLGMGYDRAARRASKSQKKAGAAEAVKPETKVIAEADATLGDVPAAPATTAAEDAAESAAVADTGANAVTSNGHADPTTVGSAEKAATPKRRKSTKSTTKSPKTPKSTSKTRPSEITTEITSNDIQAAVANVGYVSRSKSAKTPKSPIMPSSPKLSNPVTTGLERNASTKSKRARRLTAGSETASLAPTSPTAPRLAHAENEDTENHGPTYHIIASGQ